MLSGFIKIAQMLVVQKAVVDAQEGLASHSADLLDEMRARFLIHGTRSPFSWASRLRVYGKKIRDSTTSLGYISWADDGTAVSYKDISRLRMDDFRRLVHHQVGKAQRLLEDLLLKHPEETRDDIGVEFRMHRVFDNASENAKGWSFLRHERNLASTLPDRENWLLERVLSHDWLQDEFFVPHSTTSSPTWNQSAVKAYKAQVDTFLETLLLLVHMTSGQPARGTELLSLRYTNTVNGHHRNIFVDNGMVSTVTTYHKGYNITGSTKIIHRYLPKEVGELLIYYLWIIRPFSHKIDLLALHKRDQPSPFIWAGTKAGETWDSSRLSRVLRREFSAVLGLSMNIPIYRHLAIAISRKHLKSGGFKRDYGLEDTKYDSQASHSSWTAGSIYARGLEEAAGHVEGRKAEYKKLSQEWHQYLGFLPSSLPPRKRPLSEITNIVEAQAKRREDARLHSISGENFAEK